MITKSELSIACAFLLGVAVAVICTGVIAIGVAISVGHVVLPVY